MTNTIEKRLVEVFGKVPAKTTSFHTSGKTAVFVTTDTKRTPVTVYVDVEMNETHIAALREYKMLGSFGWSLQ